MQEVFFLFMIQLSLFMKDKQVSLLLICSTEGRRLLCVYFSKEKAEVLKRARPTFTSAFSPTTVGSLTWQVGKLGSSYKWEEVLL